jgi:hypothetical protein
MSKAEEAAVAAANTLLEEGVEAEETPSEPTEEPAAVEPQETELPEEVPDEIKDIWEMPDFEEQAEAEIAAETPEEEEYEYTEESEELASERKKRIAAEKKTAWLEAQRVRESAGKWKAEALKYTPYCEPFIEDIASRATSRRALLREAKRVNDVVEAWADTKYGKPSAEQEAALRAELEAKIRKEYQDNGWGTITAGPGEVPAEAREKMNRVQTLLNNRAPLEQVILARKDAGDFDNL